MSLSIYIHIPFCLKKCDYCDFKSVSLPSIPEKEYTESVIKEIRFVTGALYDKKQACLYYKKQACLYYEKMRVKSIYFGGGTPSLFSADSIAAIISELRNLYDVEIGAEITLEANPKTADYKKLSELKDIGINRLSIGVQSFNDSFLKILGRVHDSRDALEMYNNARKAGFDNINLDLIFGIPTQTIKALNAELKKLTELSPEHISAYMLTLEKATPLFNKIKNGKFTIDDDLCAKMFTATGKYLTENRYKHYEISAYAKEGRESVHNLNYWKYGEYIGFGAAAHSMVKNYTKPCKLFDDSSFPKGSCALRWCNVSSHTGYINKVNSSNNAVKNYAALDEEKCMTEFLIMGLRLLGGLLFSDFKEEFGREFLDIYAEKTEKLISAKLVVITNNSLKLTPKGVLYLNEVLVNLI